MTNNDLTPRPLTAAERYANTWDRVVSRQILASQETGSGRGPEGAWPDGRYNDNGNLGEL